MKNKGRLKDQKSCFFSRGWQAAEKILIVREFVESITAKKLGRPIFNEMLRLVERGEADALLAWHPDRLASSSVDGGRIIYRHVPELLPARRDS